MTDLDRGASSIEEHLAHIVAPLDTLATNRNHLDEALLALTVARIRSQEQFRDADSRISSLAGAIGQLIVEMRTRPN